MQKTTDKQRYRYVLLEDTYAPTEEKPMNTSLLRLRGISARNIQEHYKLYQGYVRKTNEIRSLLRTADRTEANATYSMIRELKLEESYATNGAKLHEMFFENLGGPGGKAPLPLFEVINQSFGSYQFWEEDFKAAGMAMRGWVILAWDRDYRTLHNYSLDAHNMGLVAKIEPLLVLDVYEHAYYMDYGTDRRGYIEAFFVNIDWQIVIDRYQQAIS